MELGSRFPLTGDGAGFLFPITGEGAGFQIPYHQLMQLVSGFPITSDGAGFPTCLLINKFPIIYKRLYIANAHACVNNCALILSQKN